jgi:transcriptional regulator with XRE-family HTH domain
MASKPANRVRVLRKKLKWSQRKLAKQAKTTQQQIQRIETEQRSVRIDLALRICSALGQPLATVFPKTARTVGAAIQQHGENPQAALQHLLSDREASAELERARVAADLLEYDSRYASGVARTGSRSASTPLKSRACGRYCRTTGHVSIGSEAWTTILIWSIPPTSCPGTSRCTIP